MDRQYCPGVIPPGKPTAVGFHFKDGETHHSNLISGGFPNFGGFHPDNIDSPCGTQAKGPFLMLIISNEMFLYNNTK